MDRTWLNTESLSAAVDSCEEQMTEATQDYLSADEVNTPLVLEHTIQCLKKIRHFRKRLIKLEGRLVEARVVLRRVVKGSK